MSSATGTAYVEQCLFQGTLDRAFPRGALCAHLEKVEDRLRLIDPARPTGRLMCSKARRNRLTRRWQFEILMDFRRDSEPNTEAAATRVWIEDLSQIQNASGLWEAQIVGHPDRILRLNAEPQNKQKPSRKMWRAVTDAHEADLFPHAAGRRELDEAHQV